VVKNKNLSRKQTTKLAAGQKGWVTYEHLIDLTDDPCIKDTLRFLLQQEVVPFQRFGEKLNTVQEHMSKTNMWCGCEMKE